MGWKHAKVFIQEASFPIISALEWLWGNNHGPSLSAQWATKTPLLSMTGRQAVWTEGTLRHLRLQENLPLLPDFSACLTSANR